MPKGARGPGDMATERPARVGRPGCFTVLLIGSAAAIVAIVLVVAGTNALARRHESDVLRDWAASGESLDQFLARFPATPDDASALETERLAAACGINLTPGGATRTWTVATGYPRDEVNKAGSDLLDPAGAALPVPLTQWIAVHEAEIDRLADHLVADPPRWGVDLIGELRLPNFAGSMAVVKLLAVRAVSEAGAGRRDRAMADLEAAWAVTSSNLRRPEDISVIIGIAQLKMESGALRRLDVVSPEWEQRLAAEDVARAMSDALRTEVWLLLHRTHRPLRMTPESGFAPHGGPWSTPVRFLLRALEPWMRLSIVDAARSEQRLADAWGSGDPCTMDPALVATRVLDEHPPWFAGKALMPDRAGIWSRMRQSQIDVELTRRILVLRRTRSPAPSASLTCPAWTFDERILPDGSAVVAFDGTLPWSLPSSTPTLPLHHADPPRPPAGP